MEISHKGDTNEQHFHDTFEKLAIDGAFYTPVEVDVQSTMTTLARDGHSVSSSHIPFCCATLTDAPSVPPPTKTNFPSTPTTFF